MLVLGIESSCDETACALWDSDSGVLSNKIVSQDEMHGKFGGVVPELASREHLLKIQSIVQSATDDAKVSLSSLDLISVTHGPGLIGALLVGVSFATAMGYALKRTVVGVNHIEGHLMAPFAENIASKSPPFPFIGLVVSGGHTSLYLVNNWGDYKLIGATRDDAAGEAFDKVAKILGLGYPGGREIDRMAKIGDPDKINFPRGMLKKGGYDFSFSGLKTAVLNYVKKNPDRLYIENISASFQKAVVDVLLSKSILALERYKIKSLVVSGGVSANSYLRQCFYEKCLELGISLYIPPSILCTDNAAMIAYVGGMRYIKGMAESVNVRSSMQLSSLS